MKKKKFLIIKIILIVIASLMIGYAIFAMNASILGGSIPMPLGFGLAEVVSPSMTTDDPKTSINVGDVIVIVPQKEYKVGDVVAFKDGNMIVTHRIIDINEDGTFATKGDNPENGKDPRALRKEYIIGKYVDIKIPNLGPVLAVLKQPIVMMMMIIVIVLLLILSGKKEKEHDESELAKIKREIALLKGNDPALTEEDIQAQIDALKREAEERNKKEK